MFSLQLPDCTRTGIRSSQGTLWLKYLFCCRFWWDSHQLNVSALSWCIKANSSIVGLKEVNSRTRSYTACKESKFLQVMPKINFLSLSFLLCDLTDSIFPSPKKSLWGKSCGPLLFHPLLVTFLLLIYCQCFWWETGFWCWNHGCCNKMNSRPKIHFPTSVGAMPPNTLLAQKVNVQSKTWPPLGS